jgi:hypothetical protein
MFPQPEIIEFKTEIPQTKLLSVLDIRWWRDDSYRNESFVGSVSVSAGPQEEETIYWSKPEPEQTKTTTPGVIIMSNGHINEMLEVYNADSFTNRLEHFIGQQIFIIPEVEHIFFSMENDYINVWTVINILDREVRRNIYDAEYGVMDFFKDLRFDFHVICRNNRNIKELHPSEANYILHR